MQKQQGFTLIELMIVVAIIGILAAIAIPQYQSYVKRAKVTEAINATSACKTSVAEYYSVNGELPPDGAAGCQAQSSDYVSSVEWNAANDEIRANIQGISGIYNDSDTGYYALTASTSSDNLTWSCSSSHIDKEFLPANCRGS